MSFTLPTPLTAKKTRSTLNLVGSSTNDSAQNTRSRAFSKASDRASIPGSYEVSEIDSEEQQMLNESFETSVSELRETEKEKQTPTTSIDLSIHSLFQGFSTENLISIVNNLKNLTRLLISTTDGSK